MPYVYRRPFDYPQHRQAFNHWQLASSIEVAAAAAAFTTYPATITSAGVETTQYSRVTRFAIAGIYRNRWPYAVQRSRINLFYTDAVEIQAQSTSADFTTYAADVRIGASSGGTITVGRQDLGFTTYGATITGARRDPLNDAEGTFTTHRATLTRTEGLGVSREGHVAASASGTYTGGTTRVQRRSGRKASGIHELTKRK